jgi:hypothetical protein
MGNATSPDDGDQSTPDAAPERKLRGSELRGSERKRAADHADYEKARNPDTELHLDGEEDTLYNDGLDIEEDDDADTLAGTRGSSSGIKP